MTETMPPELLLPWGKTLLAGTFAFCLIRAMRGLLDIQTALERFAIGFLALIFYKAAGSVLTDLSQELSNHILSLNNQVNLKAVVLEAFKKASAVPVADGKPTSYNIPAIIEQAWRTGVWGVMSTVVDWIFLISSFLLESAKEVFWNLVILLFPVACGVYPLFPRMLTNLTIYAVELSLWFPVLSLVEMTTGAVARNYMSKVGSWGLYVVATELLAIILIFLIPSVTHRFLSGAFTGDFEAQASLLRSAKKAVFIAKTWGMAR